MPRKIFATLLSSLCIMTGGGSVYAQMPPQNMGQNIPEDEAAPHREVPAEVFTIMVENNRLSVEFSNRDFGEILHAIGQKAGFRVEGSSNVFSRKVTIKFVDLDIDEGIIRLFSLVQETNYLISYDEKGTISKLKIYNIKAGSAGAVGGITTVPAGAGAPVSPPAFRSRQRRSLSTPSPPPVPSPPPPVPQPDTPDPAENAEDEAAPDETVNEIPYIPGQGRPVNTPPIKR